jgi:Na+/melibiose symporter-like transporter
MSEEEMKEVAPMRWGYVLVIGLGFFTTGVSWSVYNSFLPADILEDFVGIAIPAELAFTIIGAIMVLDNILAFFMQSYIGAKSDKTRTRWGRRMPYIMIGTPLASLFFTLVIYGWAALNFMFLLTVVTLFNVSMAFYRAPVVALMPDVVPTEQRSKANGVINLMGGIGAIYAFAIASQIYKINDPGLGALLGVTAAQAGPVLAFLTTSVIMVVAVLILFTVVKEPEVPPADTGREEIGIVEAFRQVGFSTDKSAMAMLLAIFCWFFAYNAIETWWTTYGEDVLLFLTADAAFLLNGIALSFVIFAVPAGLVAGKLGRQRTILLGLIIMMGSLVVIAFLTEYLLILGMLAVAGVGWAFINVNSIVMVWEHLGQTRVGAGTGLYYFFSMGAAVSGPFITGVIFDALGITMLFPIALVFLVLAFILMTFVKTGEVGDEAISG